MPSNTPDRLEDMIVFFAAKCPQGKTKLAKLLWEADVEAWRRLGCSISGRSFYVRRQHGPVPAGFEDTLARLRQSGKLVRVRVPVGDYEEERHYLAEGQEVDFSSFSPVEVDILHTAIERLRALTARQASERTHDIYWEEVLPGGRMNIDAAAIKAEEITENDLAWAERLRADIVALDKKYAPEK